MSEKIFPTPQDAEAAFYEALERSDYDAMAAVWAEDEEVVCVHPGGPRLCGTEQVLAHWKRILANGQRLRVRLSHEVIVSNPMVAMHSVHENITIEGEGLAPNPVIATNVYLRVGPGWRMVAHHASPAPGPARGDGPTPATATLH